MLKKMLSLFTLGMFVIYLGLLTYGCASAGGGDSGYYRSYDFVIPDHGIPSDLP
jgi:hypothetical protein